MGETQFTKNIRSAIKGHKGGSIKLGASQFLPKGTPDMVCSCFSKTFFIESKVHPNKLSPIQAAFHKQMRDEGFMVFTVTLMPDDTIKVDGGKGVVTLEHIDALLLHLELIGKS